MEYQPHFITNIRNNKKIYFRKQLWPFLLVVVLIGYVVFLQVLELNSTVDELIAYQDRQSQFASKTIAHFQSQRDRAQTEVELKKAEIAKKNQELQKVNKSLQTKETELAQKIKDLSETQNQIKLLQTQIANQESQLAANSDELNQLRSRPPLFSFRNESSLNNIEEKKAQVKDVVTNAYDYVVGIYGSPYLLHSITITFVDNFTVDGAAGEIKISNSSEGLAIDIRLQDFDKNNFNDVNAVIHEIIHSFHGIAVFDTTVYEEGITVAATDIVLSKMIAAGKLPDYGQLYISINKNTYDNWNAIYQIPEDYNAFYNSPNVTKFYQMAGFAWNELYKSDNNFFKSFNEKFYNYIQNGEDASNDLVKSIISEVVSTAYGQAINSFLSKQRVFNPI